MRRWNNEVFTAIFNWRLKNIKTGNEATFPKTPLITINMSKKQSQSL